MSTISRNQIFNIDLFMNVGNWKCSRTMHVVVYFKCLPQICTKMNGFKFDFSKIFWGGAHRAPSPDPSPRFFSGFALGSGFALNSQALCNRASPSILGRFAPSIWASPSTFGWKLGLAPPKINSWIRHWKIVVISSSNGNDRYNRYLKNEWIRK